MTAAFVLAPDEPPTRRQRAPTRTIDAAASAGRCVRCGRALKDRVSVARGMGPVCAGMASRTDNLELFGDEQPVLNGVGTLEDVGLVCRRLNNGRIACNVPQIVKHHSQTGFEVGYGGSGPADLALNVLHLLLPPLKHAESPGWGPFVGVGDVAVSGAAYRWHQEMKFKFIATMGHDGGRIPIEDIREWLAQKMLSEVA